MKLSPDVYHITLLKIKREPVIQYVTGLHIMATTKKNKITLQQPDFSISKSNQEKGNLLYNNFYNGTKTRLERNPKAFSSMALIQRTIKQSKEDPSMEFIMEVIRRLEKDKVNSETALQIAEIAQSQSQQMQKITLLKMIPFFVGLLGMMVFAVLSFTVRPLSFTNPELLKFMIPMALFIPIFIWGLKRRKDSKFDLLAANVVMQGASAYSSAKMQGKGQIGALQNLEEMRRRAKTMQAKETEAKKKDDKKEKTKK